MQPDDSTTPSAGISAAIIKAVFRRRSADYRNITFKHLLLPVWISAYQFQNKTFRFLVNARTGEVQGERPWSWVKIMVLVSAIVAVIAIFVVIASMR